MFKNTKQIILMLPIQQLPGYYRSRYEDLYFNSSFLRGASFHKAHTADARSACESRHLLFWNFFPRLLLSVLNITALVMHGRAVKFQLLPTYGASRHTTYKTVHKSWSFIPPSSCAPVGSWLQQQGHSLSEVHLHPSTPPLVMVQTSLCFLRQYL